MKVEMKVSEFERKTSSISKHHWSSLAAEEISFTNVFTPVCLNILIYIQQTVILKVCPTVWQIKAPFF